MIFFEKLKRRFFRAISAFIAVFRDQVTHYPPAVIKFENCFKDTFGANYAVSFANGSSAIEAAMFAAGIKPGDEVLLPSYSFHSGAAAILAFGAKPIYIDNEEKSLSPSNASYIKNINQKTKAVLILHPWGFPYNFNELNNACKKRGISIIEDCSHSHGAKIENKYVGTMGDIGCFSLQGYKSISAGEGGICITNSENIRDRLKLYGHFGRDYSGDYNDLKITGYGKKYRANPIGLSIAQYDLKNIHRDNFKRNQVFKELDNIFSKSRSFTTFPILNMHELGGHYQGFPILLRKKLIEKYGSISEIINFFQLKNIISFYRPIKPLDSINYLNSPDNYREFFYEDFKINEFSDEICNNAEHISNNLIHFPLDQFINRKSKIVKLNQIVDSINND